MRYIAIILMLSGCVTPDYTVLFYENVNQVDTTKPYEWGLSEIRYK